MLATIYRDNMGFIIHAWTEKHPSLAPNIGEAQAALLAVYKATKLDLENINLEG